MLDYSSFTPPFGGTEFKVTIKRTKHWRCLLFMGCSLLVGVVIGWKGHRQFKISPNAEVRKSYLREIGDAPDAVRGEVLSSLREFQSGYSKRDIRQLDAFMQRLFPKDQSTRIIGTDIGEWRSGYESVSHFVHDDWVDWGNVRLSVDDAVINSAGETAWLATTGEVNSAHSTRAIRFTAVLTRRDGQWLFRQIQFQWDEQFLRFSDLLKRERWSELKFR